MRRARPVATDRRHTFGVPATGRAMLSNQNNSVSVCNRVTMPLTSPGVESEARAMTKRKRRLDSGMVALKLDSWTPLGEQGTEHGQALLLGTHDREPEHDRHLCQHEGLGQVVDLLLVRWIQQAGKAERQVAKAARTRRGLTAQRTP